jgi:Bacterial SH3 domain/CARDB
MKWLPNPETRAAVLKHPVFLAGLALPVLLGLTAAVLVVADSVRSTDTPGVAAGVVAPASTSNAGPTSTTTAASGVAGTTNTTTAVRTAPGTRTPVLGTLSVKSDVQIDGRTTDAKWMRVVFPPNNSSGLHGWIDAANLDIIGDLASLVVATAEPPAVVLLPTERPAVLSAIALAARTPRASGTRTATPLPKGILPDLVIGSPSTGSDGKLFVTVIDQGKGDMHGDLVIAVFNRDGTKLLGGATLPKFTLAAGRSIDVATGYVVSQDQSLLLVVDPNGDIAETDHANNRTTVSIAVGHVSPTPLPGQTTPTPDVPRTLAAIATATAKAQLATPMPDIPSTRTALATETARAAR